MYSTQYSCWDESRFPGFSKSLNRIYEDSIAKYKQGHPNIIQKDYEMIATFLKDMEYHFLVLINSGIATKKNYTTILEQLKSLELVRILPADKRDFYGLTYQKQISINPDIHAQYGMDEVSLKQMCVSHELGHIINGVWKSDMKNFCHELFDDPRIRTLLKHMDLEDEKYLRYGFSLLDEVVAQEVAERVGYQRARRERPKREYRRDKAIFNHNPYLTNYIFYGELQEFAIQFARSIPYMNCLPNDSDEEVLLKLARRSFDCDFIKNIRESFQKNPNQMDSFVMMLACMGRIKEATYQVLGLNQSNKGLNVNSYVDSFQTISKNISK